MGETSSKSELMNIKEHKIDNEKKARARHNLKTNPNFNFKDSKMLGKIHIKIVESSIISNHNNF